MSMVLWDLFTGSAPYRDILKRAIRPKFIGLLVWHLTVSLFTPGVSSEPSGAGEANKRSAA